MDELRGHLNAALRDLQSGRSTSRTKADTWRWDALAVIAYSQALMADDIRQLLLAVEEYVGRH